jgi:hypothetical protein
MDIYRMGIIVSMTVEVMEYVSKVGKWLITAPESNEESLTIAFEVPVLWYGERIGVWKDIDGWWEYFPGQ